MKPQVEWQVSVELLGDVHVHIFRTESAARKHAAKYPEPVIQEGGMIYPKPPRVFKVVRHCAAPKRTTG